MVFEGVVEMQGHRSGQLAMNCAKKRKKGEGGVVVHMAVVVLMNGQARRWGPRVVASVDVGSLLSTPNGRTITASC